MANIVFVHYPEMGHLNASLKIAKDLRKRDHRVYYCGLPDFEDYVVSQELDFIPMFEELCPKGFLVQHAVRRNLENLDAILVRAKNAGKETQNALAAEVENMLRKAQPDVLVVDLLLPQIAELGSAFGVHVILLNTQLLNPWEERKADYAPIMALTELILCPQEFEFPQSRRKTGSYYVESSIDLLRKETEFPWQALDENKPLVFCSFGSQSHLITGSKRFFDVVIETFAATSDWQLVLGVGTSLRVEDFYPVPENAIIVNIAPQLDLLKRASVMITHGGFNSVKECIYFGVPMILFPVIRDHPAIAARVAYHGLGIRKNIEKATPEMLSSLLGQVITDSKMHKRAQVMSEVFREMEISELGADTIEAILKETMGADEEFLLHEDVDFSWS